MKIWKEIWRYWKWLCVALMTTTAFLFLVATIVTHFKTPDASEALVHDCIESGGTWNADTSSCERAG